MIQNHEFEQAETLMNDMDFTSNEERMENIHSIRAVYAHYLFSIKKEYVKAIQVLKDINATPVDIVNLYPEYDEIAILGTDNSCFDLVSNQMIRTDSLTLDIPELQEISITLSLIQQY